MTEREMLESVLDGEYYWAWVDPSTHYAKLPPRLEVIRVTKNETVNWFDGCGTDEDVRVVRLVAKIEPPGDDA